MDHRRAEFLLWLKYVKGLETDRKMKRWRHEDHTDHPAADIGGNKQCVGSCILHGSDTTLERVGFVFRGSDPLFRT